MELLVYFIRTVFILSLSLLLASCFSKDVSGEYVDDSLNVYVFSKEGLYEGPLAAGIMNNNVTLPYKVEDGLIKAEMGMAGTTLVFKVMDDGSLIAGTTGTKLTKIYQEGEGGNVKLNEIGFREYRPGSIVRMQQAQHMKEDIERLKKQGFEISENVLKFGDGRTLEQTAFNRKPKSFETYAGLNFDLITLGFMEGVGNEVVSLAIYDEDKYAHLKQAVEKNYGKCEEKFIGNEAKHAAKVCYFTSDEGYVRVATHKKKGSENEVSFTQVVFGTPSAFKINTDFKESHM